MNLFKSLHLFEISFGGKETQLKAVRGRAAGRGGRRVQTNAEENMADTIAEVDDVTAVLNPEKQQPERNAPLPLTALIPGTVLRIRFDKTK